MYITSNGTPIVIATDREHAATLLWVRPDDIFQVEELSPRDRHPELVEAMNNRTLYGIAC